MKTAVSDVKTNRTKLPVRPELVEGFVTQLGSITKPRKEKVLPSSYPNLSYIGLEHIESETMRLIGSSSANDMRSTANRFYDNDVLYSRLRPYLNKVHRASIDGLCSSEFIVFPPTELVAPDFLRYRLNAADFVSFANSLDAGDRPRVNFEQISAFEFWLPSPPTQRRIVAEIEEKLSHLDAAQSALLRAQTNLKRYRDLIVMEAVTGGRDSLDKSWDPDESPALPNGWRWAPLANVAQVTGGLAKSANRKTSQPTRFVPYLRVANVQRGYLDLTEIKEIEATDAEIYDLRLEQDDVLFNEGGDRDKLGRGWLWERQLPEAIHQNHVFRARADQSQVLPLFLSYCGNSYGAVWFWRHGKQTTNLASISLRVLRAFPILLPPLAIQHQIVEQVESRLSVIDRTEATLRTQLARSKRLRQSILQQAFSHAEGP